MAEIKIAGTLHNTEAIQGDELHSHVVANANEILDTQKGKKQSDVNADVDAALDDRYTKDETYSQSQVRDLITTPDVQYVSVAATSSTTDVTDVLPAEGSADTIYRVGNWDGTQPDASVYSEYAWNGTAYILLSVKTAVDEVFDISVFNADGNTPATYANLSAALGVDGANVPSNRRKGGMSVKFISSETNEYLQDRLMATAFSTNTADWQGVEAEPTAGSRNLVESGGVAAKIDGIVEPVDSVNLFDKTKILRQCYVRKDNGVTNGNQQYFTTDFIPIDSAGCYAGLGATGGVYLGYACYSSPSVDDFTHGFSSKQATYEEGDAYVRFSGLLTQLDSFMVVKGTSANYPSSYVPYGKVVALKNDIVDTYNIKNNAVTTEQIADEAITVGKLDSELAGYVDDFKSINGKEYYVESATQYQIIINNVIGAIKQGSTIYNRGVSIATMTRNDDASSRHDIAHGEAYVAQNDIGYISALYAGTVDFVVLSYLELGNLGGQIHTIQLEDDSVSEEKIKSSAVTESKINDGAVSLSKVSFKIIKTGKNKLNPATVKEGKYINKNTGQENIFNQFACTDFIPVSVKGLYCNYGYYGGEAIGGCAYDSNKSNPRSIGNDGKKYTYQEGDAYVRFSLRYYNPSDAYVIEGTEPGEYEPYATKEVITPDALPNIAINPDEFASEFSNNANENKIFTGAIDVFLPDKIYAVVGDTLQLFFQGMPKCVNIESYNTLVACTKGRQYRRYFQFTPQAEETGTVPFNFYIKDSNKNILGQGSSSIVTVGAPASPSSNVNILCVGDSITAGGQWPKEFMRRLTANDGSPVGNNLSNITFVGSMLKNGVHYEGNSGYSWGDYATRGRAAFRFTIGSGANVTNGAVYSNNGHQYTVIEVSDNNTIRCSTDSFNNTPTSSGTLVKVSGSGDNTITFTDSAEDSRNPFWDAENNKLSFTKYATQYCNGTIDVIYVLLGGNALFTNQMNNVMAFIDAFHTDFPNGKVKLMGMYVPSMKLMMPGYGASGSQYADTYGVICKLKDQAREYQSLANKSEYSSFVEYIDVACQLDSDYNFPVTQKDVNTRNNSVTEPCANNNIHASPSGGYMQIADVAYRNFVANYCQ